MFDNALPERVFLNLGKTAFAPDQSLNVDELLTQASLGSREAASVALARPTELKISLDKLVGRAEGENSLIERQPGEKFWGYSSGFRSKERFGERGLPASVEDLNRQYQALSSKEGRVDFKHDVQSIERAIITGSREALSAIIERSPMALWAMDFSLSEYEAENVMAFAAKYAPPQSDLEIVDLLRSMGAKLPAKRLALDSGAAIFYAKGIHAKPVDDCAAALMRAGYEFSFADGLHALMAARLEAPALGMPRLIDQKIQWLDWIQAHGVADWSAKHSHGQLQAWCEQLPFECASSKRVAEFLEWTKTRGEAGLGAWVGLSSAPLREPSTWEVLGPWLAKHGLASEALLAAKSTGAAITWPVLLPWAEKEVLTQAAPALKTQDRDNCRL